MIPTSATDSNHDMVSRLPPHVRTACSQAKLGQTGALISGPAAYYRVTDLNMVRQAKNGNYRHITYTTDYELV